MASLVRDVADLETSTADLADIRAYCRVVDTGSITAAARSLGETKGTVSRRVGRLERALGTALVQRTGNRLQVTEDGAAYRDKAGRALEQLDEAAATLRDSHQAPSGHLRVTAPTDLGTMLLAPLLAGFGEAYPGVTVELLLTHEPLSLGEVDLALRATPGLPDSSLIAHRLFELAIELVAAPAYLASHPAPVRPEDLHDHRMVLMPIRGPVTPLALRSDAGERVELMLRAQVLTRDMQFAREAAVGGAGIALLPRHLATREVAAGRLVRVLDGWGFDGSAQLYLLHNGGPLPAKVRVFRDYVRSAVRDRCEAGTH